APYVANTEEDVARALRDFREDVEEAEQNAQQGGSDEQGELTQALNDLESLRRRLEEAAGGGQQEGLRSAGMQPGQQRAQAGSEQRQQPAGQREQSELEGQGAGQGEPQQSAQAGQSGQGQLQG